MTRPVVVDDGSSRTYIKDMRWVTVSAAMLAVALLGLTATNCVIPWLASAEAHECCAQGGCHATMTNDDCCSASNPDSTRHYQSQSPVRLAAELSATVEPRIEPAAVAVPVAAPSGFRERTSLPLLI
jgi:hypothetical protein